MSLALLVCCRFSPVVDTDSQVRCTKDNECPTDAWKCQQTLALCVAVAAYDDEPPRLLGVNSLQFDTITVSFSEPMAHVDASAFSIGGGDVGLSVLQVAVSEDAQTVSLTTTAQDAERAYTLSASGLTDLAGNALVDPSSLGFAGFGVADRTPPRVLNVNATQANEVVVSFSEAVFGGDALAAYAIDSGGLAIEYLTLSADAQAVTLHTALQTPERVYTLSVSAVTDGAQNTLEAPTSIDFAGFGVADRTAPMLTSVVATHSGGVVAHFSEAIFATGPVVASAEIAGLAILNAKIGADNSSIEVTTSEQLPGASYTLVVSALVDAAGNPLAPTPSVVDFTGYGVPDTSPPKQLAPLGSLLINPTEVELVWTPRSGAASYTIEISNETTFATVLHSVTVASDTTSLRFPSVTPALPALSEPLTYFWRVRASNTAAAFTNDLPYDDPGAFAASYFDVVRDAIFVGCPSRAGCVAGARIGNRCKPYSSIMSGIGAARVHGLHEVRVEGCGHGEPYVEQVDVADGVDLLGGFDPDFTVADPLNDVSRIESSSIAVLTGTSIVNPTHADGFVVAGSAGGNALAIAYGAYFSQADALTLERFTFLPRSAISFSIGVYVGNSAAAQPLGTGVQLRDNVINSGNAEDYGGAETRAVHIEGSSVVLVRNVLQGGEVTTGSSAFGGYTTSGLHLSGSKLAADRNTIRAGNGVRATVTPPTGPDPASWVIDAYVSTLRLTNNVIESGNLYDELGANLGSGAVFGVYTHESVGTSVFTNNTFIMHNSGDSVRGIYADGRPIVANNLIVSTPNTTGLAAGNTAYSELNDLATYVPLSYHGNVLVGFPSCPYRRFNGTSYVCLTTSGAINTYLTTTVSIPNGFNTLIGGASAATLVNFVNLQPLVGAGQYGLTNTTPAPIKTAGIDASMSQCGTAGAMSCGSVNVDYSGTTRTCAVAGSACYSVGAFEVD